MTVDNSDQVVGASKEELEHALALIRADRHRKVAARAAFVSYVRKTMLDESAALISLASQKQIQRSAGLRQHLMEEEGFETYASLALRRARCAPGCRECGSVTSCSLSNSMGPP